MTGRITIGVVGSGGFGLKHLAAYARRPDVELVGVADVDAARARRVSGELGVRCFSSAADLVRECRPDGVSVVTPSREHVEPTLTALASGCSVLLEKPVAQSVADVARLRRAELASPGFVMPAHLLRFAPSYTEAKSRVRALGPILAVASLRDRSRDHQQRYPADHPALLTLIHDIDLALWLTDAKPVSVVACGVGNAADRQPPLVWATIAADDGSVWSLRTSWLLDDDAIAVDRLDVYGDRGTLHVELGSDGDELDRALDAEVEHFCSCIRSGSAPTVVSLGDAEMGIRVAEAVIASAAAAEPSPVIVEW